MGQPQDPRAFHPRFFEVLERAAAGEEIWFRFPGTQDGHNRCFSLRMQYHAFIKSLRYSQYAAQLAEETLAAAWAIEIKHWHYKDRFVVRPQMTWNEELAAALDHKPGDD